MNKILSKLLVLFCCLMISSLYAQQDSVSRDFFCGTNLIHGDKGTLYLAFGYNKNWYSPSDIHIKDESGDYDFVLHNMKAHDRTHFNELFKVAISIPQYGYRIGYWFPKSPWGIEIKFDHPKYIVYDEQTVHLEGKILDKMYDTDTLVGNDFLQLEHTDGANFLMVNGMYRRTLFFRKHISVYGVGKFGVGIVVPRSDVTLFGQRWNHCFHNAGQVFGFEAGVRVELFRFFFIEPSMKGVYANFNKVLAIDDILISHRFWDGMALLDFGLQVHLGKPKQRTAQPTW